MNGVPAPESQMPEWRLLSRLLPDHPREDDMPPSGAVAARRLFVRHRRAEAACWCSPRARTSTSVTWKNSIAYPTQMILGALDAAGYSVIAPGIPATRAPEATSPPATASRVPNVTPIQTPPEPRPIAGDGDRRGAGTCYNDGADCPDDRSELANWSRSGLVALRLRGCSAGISLARATTARSSTPRQGFRTHIFVRGTRRPRGMNADGRGRATPIRTRIV